MWPRLDLDADLSAPTSHVLQLQVCSPVPGISFPWLPPTQVSMPPLAPFFGGAEDLTLLSTLLFPWTWSRHSVLVSRIIGVCGVHWLLHHLGFFLVFALDWVRFVYPCLSECLDFLPSVMSM